MMIKYMILGLPFLYQSICGNVYHVCSDGVRIITSWEPSKNIVAFVDADAMNLSENSPQAFLHRSRVQFILASSPKSTKQKWTKQAGVTMMRRIVNLWTPWEFYVTGIFLNPQNLDLANLRESTLYFGFNPRNSFNACKSGFGWDYYRAEIVDTIRSIKPRDVSLHALMNGTISASNDSLSHLVFEILPSNENRYFSEARVQPVSSWVLEQLLEHYEQHDANAAADFYDMIMAVLRNAGVEVNINHPMAFKSQSLPTIFKEFVKEKEARHMVLLIPNFAAVDSILYAPASVLTGFQITINQQHRFQTYQHRTYPIPPQKYEGDTVGNWAQKIDRYVLGLEKNEVWRKYKSDPANGFCNCN
ncbi:hypothetical protein M378DRAFT_821552 [Amanita muscaria Koide BX008]|uniref:Uncharacterized protein n=1 Tax=Amanita muscaria (strain Koide BX008) TaxID=946122 RepID=A0A0C2WJP5_AMAMK|nr:hypothetical protein M378DRAFT_821552 [Amanita muscaria Koide BX008]